MVALLAMSGLLASGTALAQPAAGLTLRWEAPAGCPQQGELRERIRKLTGVTSATATILQAEGTITQTDNRRFHLRLVMRSGNLVGERNLDATSCENLSGAAAVSLALLLRSPEPLDESDLDGQPPAAATATVAPASSKPAETSLPAASVKASPSDPARSDSVEVEIATPRPEIASERNWRFLAQAPLAALSFGSLPEPSWGLAFAGGVSLESWRFLLGGTAWRRQSVQAAQSPAYGADVDRLTGTLKACRALRRSVFEVAPCLGLSLEHVSARGTGPDITARSEQATWLSVGAGAQGRLYLASWFSVVLGAEAQIQTARPLISIAGVGDLTQLGAAAFAVTLGPEWIF